MDADWEHVPSRDRELGDVVEQQRGDERDELPRRGVDERREGGRHDDVPRAVEARDVVWTEGGVERSIS